MTHTDVIFLDFSSFQWNPVTLYRAEREGERKLVLSPRFNFGGTPWDSTTNSMFIFGGNSLLPFLYIARF